MFSQPFNNSTTSSREGWGLNLEFLIYFQAVKVDGNSMPNLAGRGISHLYYPPIPCWDVDIISTKSTPLFVAFIQTYPFRK